MMKVSVQEGSSHWCVAMACEAKIQPCLGPDV